jgi:hypothetical protein
MSGENKSARKSEMKKMRMSEWKAMVETELQQRMTVAADIRKIMTESKTSTKRDYYGKKFKKLQGEIYRLVSALQKLTVQEDSAPADPATTLNLTPTYENEQSATAA